MLLITVVLLVGSVPAWAAGTGSPPAALPGPPPGAGTGRPAAPAPGSTPAPQPLGPTSTIPAHVSGPGLESGTARVHGGRFSLAIVCQKSGRVSVTAPALGAGIVARGGYSCADRRAVAHLSLNSADVHRLSALGSTLAGLTLGSEQLSLTLETHAVAPAYWSNGGMECNLLGQYEPYLAAPDFSVSTAVVIDVRPWIAWYTQADGWRWIGTAGLNASSWYSWTATPQGVSQWVTPAGAINPWTWAPIYVHPGLHTYAISVFEVVYQYSQASYAWKYGESVGDGKGITTYCAFP